jgi:hypothetical protein
MTSCCRGLVLGLAVVAAALTAGRAQDAKSLGQEVLELARESAAGKDVAKGAQALGKRFGSARAAMRLYNPRSSRNGGIGFGPRGLAIERRLIDLGEQATSAQTLKKESAELTRVAHVNLVMAEVLRGFAPAKPFLGRGKKEWEQDLEAMKVGSRGLLKALEAGDPKAVQAAAARINNACNSCHDFER